MQEILDPYVLQVQEDIVKREVETMYCIKQDLTLFKVTGINAVNVGFYFTEEVLDPSVPKVMEYMIKLEANNTILQLTL